MIIDLGEKLCKESIFESFWILPELSNNFVKPLTLTTRDVGADIVSTRISTFNWAVILGCIGE